MAYAVINCYFTEKTSSSGLSCRLSHWPSPSR